VGKKREKPVDPSEAKEPKESHVRLSPEMSRMLSWVWYLERETTGETQSQIVESLARPGLAKRYGSLLPRVKQITEALGRKYEEGTVPLPPTRTE
jgi:hypothetical protein